MAVRTPDNATQVTSNIKADVQRAAPDSNPYLDVHWLASLIAGIGRRDFDLILDLRRTENRLFPDTEDEEAAEIWGNILLGPKTAASAASGQLVATGTAGGTVIVGTLLTAGGVEYSVTGGATINLQSLNVTSITRSGATASVITAGDHGLSSFVPVDIAGADQPEYNVTAQAIVVTGLDSFDYQVSGTPVTATGTILCGFTTANVTVQSLTFSAAANLDLDTSVTLQSPIANVDDTLFVTFAAVGGGTDVEAPAPYQIRYLSKLRNPVAHFNGADITAKALEVSGVTRVFVNSAGTEIGTIAITSLTRTGNFAIAVTGTPHGFVSGQNTSVTGAVETDYNVTNERILVENDTTFLYGVLGMPTTPATGLPVAATSIPLGQSITFFMRDNDPAPIPSASEVVTVKAAIDTIRPANTSVNDNIVLAPTAVVVPYTFTAIVPNTLTMQAAIEANLVQFHAEQVTVGVDVLEDKYRAAISNTVDPDTGDALESFGLSTPSSDIPVDFGEIATKGLVSF